MEVKLKVLGGARSGTEIPLRHDEFVIGRAADCNLRAGSDAISRRHCAITLDRSSVRIRDLGSRNGTYVNDDRIDGTVPLGSGDEVRVGPLRFQILINRGLDARKLPEVKDVAEAAARTAQQAELQHDLEASISEWLSAPASESKALKDTANLRMDETHAVSAGSASSDPPRDEEPPPEVTEAPVIEAPVIEAQVTEAQATSEQSKEETESAAAADRAGQTEEEDDDAAARQRRKKPGKLPPRPKGSSTKDSREAAAEVLRSITRRR